MPVGKALFEPMQCVSRYTATRLVLTVHRPTLHTIDYDTIGTTDSLRDIRRRPTNPFCIVLNVL